MIRFLVLLIAFSLPVKAEEVVAGLSQNRIAITANFDGSEILIFGAVKRDKPAPDTDPLQVIVAVAGPSEPVTVRRKSKRFGIWVNVDSIAIESAPTFYSIATTASFSDVINDAEDQLLHVSIPRAIRRSSNSVADAENFIDALIRIRTKSGLYQVNPGTIKLEEDTLFQTSVALPSNLTEGEYSARIILTRGGHVLDVFETDINVQKVGIERWLFNLAHEKPLVYGLLSLFIAITAGWGASAIFRYFRP
ncbi:MAG: TIGR02186 family protein [Paracoccaceae bacterium]